jgi:hypothetical protein
VSGKTWTLVDAQDLLRRIELALDGTHHVGLLGSVPLHGTSDKDLDIVIYPHSTFGNSSVSNRRRVRTVLDGFGLRQIASGAMVLAEWEKKGSQDSKFVEVWLTEEGRRVDVFYMQ